MQKRNTGMFLTTLLIAGAAATAQIAFGLGNDRKASNDFRQHDNKASFQRVSTLANYKNNGAANIGTTTVSEIIAATRDGKTLVYTDSPGGQIGFVDITNPANPTPTGVLAMGGEPTSVDVLGNRYALVAVNTSTDFINTSGKLVVVDLTTTPRTIVGNIDLGVSQILSRSARTASTLPSPLRMNAMKRSKSVVWKAACRNSLRDIL
jgi:hypothetical protein